MAHLKLDITKGKRGGGLGPKRRGPVDDHCGMLDLEDSQTTILDILFFDGSTQPNADDPSGYAAIPEYIDNPTVLCDVEYTLSSALTALQHKRFVQNQHIRDMDASTLAAFYTNQWTAANPLGASAILNRRWFEIVRTSAIQENQGVFPVSTMTPNIKATLLDNDGNELQTADVISVQDGTSEAIVSDQGDYEDILAYRWFGVQNAGHLKVEETQSKGFYVVSSAGIYNHGGGGMEQLFAHNPHDPGQNATLKYEIEGVFWNWFDTSDTDNFKITETCAYDATEYTEPVVQQNSIYKKLRIYLIPRSWWGMARYSTCQTSERTDVCYGIWTIPPKDFEMPAPRKTGSWQTSHVVNVPDNNYYEAEERGVDGGFFNYNVALDDTNSTTNMDLTADDELGNGFVLFHRYWCNVPGQNYEYVSDGHGGWLYLYPGHSRPEYPFVGDDWVFNFSVFPDSSLRGTAIETVKMSPSYQLPWLHIENGFFGSMPDAKLPVMSKSITLSEGDDYYPTTYEFGVYIASRLYQYLDTTDVETFLPDEVTKITDLKTHFLTRAFMGEVSQSPDSFLFGCAEAREGDLVGVIEADEKLLFVWRRADERFAYSGNDVDAQIYFGTGDLSTANDLAVGSKYMNHATFHHGYYASGAASIPCVEFVTWTHSQTYGVELNIFGCIEIEDSNQLTPDPDVGMVPRMIRFGSYADTPDYPTHRVALVHGEVDLSPGVRPLYYERNDYDKWNITMRCSFGISS